MLPARPFFTRSPELAALKRLVLENIDHAYDFKDFNRLFRAVDGFCAAQCPGLDRGDWFGPKVVGGAQVRHTPSHIVFAVLAIYLHLAKGDMDPVPFLSAPLDLDGATAVMIEPTGRFTVAGSDGIPRPMTDFLVFAPALTPVSWIMDTYGLLQPRAGVMVIGWHAAAQPDFRALSSGQLLLHTASRKVLNPLAAFTEEEERTFFDEPVIQERLQRHRDRLVEVFGTPLEAMQGNLDAARRVVEAYLAV